MPQFVEVNGQTIQFPDGMTPQDMESAIKANILALQPQKPVSVKAGSALNDIPRQVGLTARYGMEGLANMAQIATEPIRFVTDRLTGNVGNTKPLGVLATQFADSIGLPSPQGANERVIGDATRLMAGAGAGAKLAQMGAQLPGMAGEVLSSLAANPTQQITSAGGAGLGAGASREAGGDAKGQLISSVVGGVAGGMAPTAIQSVVNAGKNILTRAASPQQIDLKISAILQNAGVDYSQIPEQAKQAMRRDMQSALNAGKELDPAAVARLADFRTVGATPTRGMVSQDPVQITKEMNLAKMAANSSDGELHGLPRLQNQNNTTLIKKLNEAGAANGDIGAAGNVVTSSVLGRQAGLRSNEQSLWDAAKTSPGYKQPINSSAISDINAALHDEGLMPFMNASISKYMEAFQTGQPFTPQAYRNLQSMLAREVAKGGNEGAAASLAQRILTKSDLSPAGFVTNGSEVVTQGTANAMRSADTAAADSLAAVNAARGATKRAYGYENSSPLVRSVLSDGASSDPQRIAQRFVIGGTANEAADLANQVGPQGKEAIKNAILSHLKDKALNSAADEVGKFSQSAYNKALKGIGDQKLALFFTPEEIATLKATGRVASYMQVQPVGSAVNNSNSGALLLGKGYDALKGLVSKVPLGQAFVIDPLRNIDISLSQRSAQNILPGLLTAQPAQPVGSSLMLPGIAMGGLLAAP